MNQTKRIEKYNSIVKTTRNPFRYDKLGTTFIYFMHVFVTHLNVLTACLSIVRAYVHVCTQRKNVSMQTISITNSKFPSM